ncbi:MAG: hypothetical protein LBN26_03900 [Christensenellaceae bacterium]|nr:hypothetical protein [Christensenellaceae bacterium]
MRNKRALMRYYKRKLYGGRGLFARVIDFISLRAIALLLCYIHFTTIVANTIIAALLSAAALGFVCVAIELGKSMRLDRFIVKERDAVAQDIARKRLLVMPRDAHLGFIRRYAKANPEQFTGDCAVFIINRASDVNADDVLRAVAAAKKRGASAVYLFYTGGVAPSAKDLAAQYAETPVAFLALAAILSPEEKAALLPLEGEIDAAMLSAQEAARQKRKSAASRPFEAVRAQRYLLCAAGLFAASFFVRYALYYRLMAAACASFGAMAYMLSKPGGSAAPR